jgi:hypothetical protein
MIAGQVCVPAGMFIVDGVAVRQGKGVILACGRRIALLLYIFSPNSFGILSVFEYCQFGIWAH